MKRKSEPIKKLQGTARRDRAPRGIEIKFPPLDDLKCPGILKGTERNAWNQLAPMLKERGVLTVADVPMLELLCVTYAIAMEARKHLAKDGFVVKNGRGGTMVKSPWVTILRQAEADTLKLMKEFGMSPSSRDRVRSTPKEEPALLEQLERMVKDVAITPDQDDGA